jgi:hypothetical protein
MFPCTSIIVSQASEKDLLPDSAVRPLLHLEKDRVFQHAQAVPAAKQNCDITHTKLPRCYADAVLIIEVDLASATLHEQDFAGTDQLTHNPVVFVARDLMTATVYHESDLEVGIRRREKARLI